ncbi:MAG: hypothetical protein NTY90_03610 [Candidatus Micrarchaeota archaeon]|nr:hypothetical protein [Candidatus Micrarchaeota archaeon]
MPNVIREMVKSGMIKHEEVKELGKNIFKAEASGGRSGEKLPAYYPSEKTAPALKKALLKGHELGLLDYAGFGAVGSIFILRKPWIQRLKAYMKAPK